MKKEQFDAWNPLSSLAYNSSHIRKVYVTKHDSNSQTATCWSNDLAENGLHETYPYTSIKTSEKRLYNPSTGSITSKG